MVTNPVQMAVGVGAIVALCMLLLVFIGPLATPYSRKQWALMMTTLFVMWIPMGWYLIFVVGTAKFVDPTHVVRAGALNLGIGVPVFIFIVMKWILKK